MARTLDDLPYVEWKEGGTTKRIYADAWKSEQISATATITEHAVETGAKVNDHYLPDQLTAKASLFISGSPIRRDLDADVHGDFKSVPIKRPNYPDNTPLLSPGGLTAAAEKGVTAGLAAIGLGSKDGPPDKATVLVFNQDPGGRLVKVWEQLLTIRQNAILVAVGFSQGRRVENLAISSLSMQRTADDGDSGTIDIEFQQLNFVSTQSAAALPIPEEHRAKPKADSVTVSAADATANQQSLASGMLDKAKSLVGG